MLLLRGIDPVKSLDSCEDEDQYSGQLHSLNEQVSFLLRMKHESFAEHLANAPICNSLLLLIATTFTNLSKPTFIAEDWKREYIELLTKELIVRAIKLADRILNISCAPLLRMVDLPQWIEWSGSFIVEHEELWFSLYSTLFRVSIVMRKQLVEFLRVINYEEMAQTDMVILTILISAGKLTIDELGQGRLAALILAISKATDMTKSIPAFRYLSRLPLWINLDVNGLVSELMVGQDPILELIPDLISSCDAGQLMALAKSLEETLQNRGKIDAMMVALPRLSHQQAEDALGKHHGNVNVAIDELLKKQSEDIRTLLDDKSFVNANMERLLMVTEDEDEYVDTFDDGTGSSKMEQSIDSRRVLLADNVWTLCL